MESMHPTATTVIAMAVHVLNSSKRSPKKLAFQFFLNFEKNVTTIVLCVNEAFRE
jgi:hypothetical protein